MVLDIFTFDVIAEMLNKPLYFLSYIDRRVKYSENLMASHELIILSYHLKNNLWIENESTMLILDDNLSADLDVAMVVRRTDVDGKDTPDGILTRMKETFIGKILQQFDNNPIPGILDLGFLLLTLSEDAVRNLSVGIEKLLKLAKNEIKHHDISVPFENEQSGVTIHCNNYPNIIAKERLEDHCRRRKYKQKAKSWFGLCIDPNDNTIRFGASYDFPWEENAAMNRITEKMQKPLTSATAFSTIGQVRKVGRNSPCPCGSGRKYKKCCL